MKALADSSLQNYPTKRIKKGLAVITTVIWAIYQYTLRLSRSIAVAYFSLQRRRRQGSTFVNILAGHVAKVVPILWLIGGTFLSVQTKGYCVAQIFLFYLYKIKVRWINKPMWRAWYINIPTLHLSRLYYDKFQNPREDSNNPNILFSPWT